MSRLLCTLVLFLMPATALAQAKTGLELLILANSHDDKAAIEEAKQYFLDDANKADIENCQKDGLPPAVPRDPDTKALKKYPLVLYKGAKSTVRYRWVELGPHELRQLNLDNDAETDAKRDATWKKAKENRGKATTVPETFDSTGERRLFQGALFYSRECQNRNLTKADRAKKTVDYFVLARQPEIDPKDPKMEGEMPPLDSNLIARAAPGKPIAERPALHIQFNEEGTRLLAVLTGKNVSVRGQGVLDVSRHLAIVVDGQVVSAPTIRSAVEGGQAFITGQFTQQEIEQLAEKIRPKK